MRQHAKPIFLAAMIVIMLVSAALTPLTEWLALGITWIETHPTMAWFVYIAIYIVATVLAFPASILTLAAGVVFGLPLALVLASVGSVLGASAAFLVGPHAAKITGQVIYVDGGASAMGGPLVAHEKG